VAITCPKSILPLIHIPGFRHTPESLRWQKGLPETGGLSAIIKPAGVQNSGITTSATSLRGILDFAHVAITCPKSILPLIHIPGFRHTPESLHWQKGLPETGGLSAIIKTGRSSKFRDSYHRSQISGEFWTSRMWQKRLPEDGTHKKSPKCELRAIYNVSLLRYSSLYFLAGSGITEVT